MTFLWSPYVSIIEANLTSIQMAYSAFLKDLQVAVKIKKRKIKLVSSIQDGVGCWDNPIYWEGFGNRTPSKDNPDYVKLLGIIKAHNLAVGKGSKVTAKVNAELFAYGPELKEWVFGSVDRISKQVQFQGKHSAKGVGPCCILTNKAMGVNYDNSKFKEGIQ